MIGDQPSLTYAMHIHGNLPFVRPFRHGYVPLQILQSGAKIFETWHLVSPLPLKQCCNKDNMPSVCSNGLLNIDCGRRGEIVNKKLTFISKYSSK